MSFSSFGLSADLLKNIDNQKYTKPYPIQEEAIPIILAGKDLLALAQTGSGKTASFVLPILQNLQHKKASLPRHVKVLVLVPTRELAMQVAEVFDSFSLNLPTKLKTMAVFGGVNINIQIDALQKCEILIATPGRLLDLMASRSVFLSEVEVLVLDEADKMLNLGFKDEMNDIFFHLPKKRQNLLFSATLNDNVDLLKSILLHEPVKIEIETEKQNLDLINQSAYLTTEERKGVLLRYLIKTQNYKQVLVFTSSTRKADNVVEKLNKNGIQAAALHGDKSQAIRTDSLKKFKAGEIRVLVATDLVSRGIDIQELPVVINYELPRSPTDYVHRIGRTGRAESKGEAITLLTIEDEHHFKIIQKKMGRKVEIMESSEFNLHGF
ncbi:MAG: DEAD/DEAH box helicase [Opitutaceae bacterium]|nr:DEAD/DEAH box helicase [Cytophagales bacterium]